MNLYEMTEDFLPVKAELEDMLANGEITNDAFLDTLSGVRFSVEAKSENVAKYIMNLENISAGMDDAVKRMQARKKALDGRVTALRGYLQAQLGKADIKVIETSDIRISFRKSTSLSIDDEALLDAFKVSKTTTSLDKKSIAQAIKDGETIDGAHLQENQNLVIK